MLEKIEALFQEASSELNNFRSNKNNISLINNSIDLFVDSIKNGGKIISCGNGGSMCDAMHFAEELTGRFRDDRIALPAISISDPAHISCVANDFGYDQIFSRYVEACGNKKDILLGISTSGNSQNVINAVEAAKKNQMRTVCLLGKDGGKLKNLSDISIIVDSFASERVQEIHIKIIHILIYGIEERICK